MATLLDLKISMDRYSVRVKDRADQIVRGGAGVFLDNVVPQTPYLTGQAVSNWLVGSGAPRTAVVKAAGASRSAAVAATISAGKARIASYKHGTNIYISNNLPYIDLLNNGYSKQAAAGFVQGSLQAVSSYIQRQKVID